MKKFLKTAFTMLLLAALIISPSMNVYAFTVEETHTIDNDDAQGYSNSRVGFDTLFQAKNLYYQDARRQVCDSDNNYYYYNFPTYGRYTTIYGRISAYLYDVSFTDPEADYMINDYSQYQFAGAGYINQDLAAPGWNVIGTARTTPAATGAHRTRMVEIAASKNHPTKNCGADAIKIELGY